MADRDTVSARRRRDRRLRSWWHGVIVEVIVQSAKFFGRLPCTQVQGLGQCMRYRLDSGLRRTKIVVGHSLTRRPQKQAEEVHDVLDATSTEQEVGGCKRWEGRRPQRGWLPLC